MVTNMDQISINDSSRLSMDSLTLDEHEYDFSINKNLIFHTIVEAAYKNKGQIYNIPGKG